MWNVDATVVIIIGQWLYQFRPSDQYVEIPWEDWSSCLRRKSVWLMRQTICVTFSYYSADVWHRNLWRLAYLILFYVPQDAHSTRTGMGSPVWPIFPARYWMSILLYSFRMSAWAGLWYILSIFSFLLLLTFRNVNFKRIELCLVQI